MEKRKYSRPTISETKLDSEMNIFLQSIGGSVNTSQTNVGMSLDESNETNGDVISQFMNPLKWFR